MVFKFRFEKDSWDGVVSIPLSTQFRLATVGAKVNPGTWNHIPQEVQILLGRLPVKTERDKDCYRMFVLYALRQLGKPVSVLDPDQLFRQNYEWENPARIPDRVYRMAVDLGFTLSPRDWLKMNEMRRYILVKLAQEAHGPDFLKRVLEELLCPESKISAWKTHSGAGSTGPTPIGPYSLSTPFAAARGPAVMVQD